ncbi:MULTISPECIES: type II toxin-antitoxin system MqsA family antitoxin [Calothrix]|uniref:Type II toxin-antitoxin system MqsA family antitoxin n=2 Tax=Calothrix TaxID=1186 RepID=A0ABR8A255_9CYAN|nr:MULTISPECIES: type II toxin-antitoxin system MqsA family antitoxin [Calothrix]MBD2194037.1 type II toxin-antitoxin system MqsA family antitoxin [Calothrix parietina FACHB-288]MBD2223044.1 type II toxin-antitoxin system MqsA family antitoxin [Calothrix anomala FACHB-343]
MQCVICKYGNTQPGFVTVTLERDHTIIILKGVPAEVCNNCGEYYLDTAVTEQVLQRAEVEILRYAA